MSAASNKVQSALAFALSTCPLLQTNLPRCKAIGSVVLLAPATGGITSVKSCLASSEVTC